MIKDKFIFLFIIMISAMSISAQQVGTTYLHIEVGAGIPSGDFGDDDIDSDDSGLASTGVMGSIATRYSLEDNFGLFGRYSFNRNAVDSEAQDDFLDFVADSVPTVDWELATTPWIVHSATFGPYFATTSGKAVFSLEGGVGLLVVTSPELEVTGDVGFDELVVRSEPANGVGFGYTISGRVGYILSEQITLIAGISFLGGEAEIESETVTELNGEELDSTDDTFTQPISVVNIPIGVSFSF